MSGHSKWSNIKYRKEKQDQVRGRIFSKLSKEITLIARNGADPAKNPALADAIERARAANMPKENIERAIKRATGELPGVKYEEAIYEGYGPGGVAVMLRVVTDNKNRATSEVRHIFEEFGGNLGGSVAWLFERRGVIAVSKTSVTSVDELVMNAIELGAEDVEEKEGEVEIYCAPSALKAVKEGLEKLGVKIERAEASLVPKNTVRLEGKDAERILKFINRLDDQEDVQEVYANFDIPDEILEGVTS